MATNAKIIGRFKQMVFIALKAAAPISSLFIRERIKNNVKSPKNNAAAPVIKIKNDEFKSII